jgi:hypothetical protein
VNTEYYKWLKNLTTLATSKAAEKEEAVKKRIRWKIDRLEMQKKEMGELSVSFFASREHNFQSYQDFPSGSLSLET